MKLTRLVLVLGLAVALGGCDRGRDPLESAILRGDWKTVLAQTQGGQGASAPVNAILAAHAGIDLNRNNEAVCLLGSLSDADRSEWDRWADALARAYPRRAVVHYLRGDSLARKTRWNDALREFDQALALDPKDALSLHARGVVRSLNDDVSGGIEDLRRAGELNPAFAAAFASRGFSYLRFKRADAAEEAFDAALKIAPDFGLATAGKAYAEFALGRWDRGNRDLPRAGELSACAADLLAPHVVQIAAWVDRRSGTSGEEPGGSPGTQMDRHLQDLTAGNLGALSAIARSLPEHPELTGKVRSTLDSLSQQNPGLSRLINSRTASGLDWTKPNGRAETLLNGLKSISGRIGVQDPRSGVGAHVDINPGSLLNEQLGKTRNDHLGWQVLQNLNGQRPIGGVTTSLVAAHVDQGDWPLLPLDGLLYGAKGGGQ
jgi:tetratricopeptide (TPR) repeat protein